MAEAISNSILPAWRRLAHRVANCGLDNSYKPHVYRRLALFNIVNSMVFVTSLSYLAFYSLAYFDELRILIYFIILQLFIIPLLPLLHRLGEKAAVLAFITLWLTAFAFYGYCLGRDSAIHYFLLPGATAGVLFLGFRPMWLTICATLAPLLLFLFVEYNFTAPSDLISMDEAALSSFYAIVKPSCIILGYFFVSVGTFHAFHTTRNAEIALEREHARSERLLQNLLPASVSERLKEEPLEIIADDLGQVSILFADIVDFTPRASRMTASELIGFLNRVFTEFDLLAEQLQLEKIKTIGDAYMVAAGLPEPREDHGKVIAEMALGMLEVCERLSQEAGEEITLRIGIHTGPAVAGVIGTRKFFYDVWGDTVNTAARMESQSLPGKIQVTETTCLLLKEDYDLQERGVVDVKGKGPMRTWWLLGRRF